MKLLCTLFMIFGFAFLSASAAEKPNIVFIMADDLGYGDLSCYGSTLINTPSLDQLAATGVRCTDFHSNGAVCSPTRAALITGRYQQRSGIGGVVTAAKHRDHGLAVDEWSIAEAMKEQGYRTALFGKWHLGYDPKFNPVKQGFDEFKGFVSGNVDYHRHIDQEGHQDWWVQDKLEDEAGYLTDLINDHAVDFITQNKSKPFMLFLMHGAPHYPIQGRNTPGFRVHGKINRNQPKDPNARNRTVYKEMIEVMDEGIGKIVAALDDLGIGEKTVIIFCSDNGPAKLGSAGDLRGKKGSVFEGGHRVAGIFNWPGQLPKGSVCDASILTMDMLPTFVSLAGGEVPAKKGLDGIDVIAALKGESLERGSLFWKHGDVIALRKGAWKFIRQKGKKHLLFDLDKDVEESTNLTGENPELVAAFLKEINDWEAEVEKEQANAEKRKNRL